MCDPSKGAAGQKTVAVLLPCLLDKGIVSTVAEVRSLRLVLHHWGWGHRDPAYSPELQNVLYLKSQISPQISLHTEPFSHWIQTGNCMYLLGTSYLNKWPRWLHLVTLFNILCCLMVQCLLKCREFTCLSLCNLIYSFIYFMHRKTEKFRPGV